MKKKVEKEEQVRYTLELTKKQAQLLSYACDQFSRLICGQSWVYQELLEAAWERRCKKATGEMMSKVWDGGWYKMRQDAEDISSTIKKRFWGLESNAYYGINYDDTADILFDIHCVIRHQLWKDNDDEHKSNVSVDAYEAMQVGNEPLVIIKKKE